MTERARTWTPYTLKSPCDNCPFRSDKFFHLDTTRVDDIANHLRSNQGDFHCHKTTGFDEETGEASVVKKTRVCAGALITMEKEGITTQSMRLGERLGLYDANALDMDSPVYASLAEWQRSYRRDEPETTLEGDPYVHCDVVAAGCEDPPAHMIRGEVVESLDAGIVHPHHDCQLCGDVCCDNCTASSQQHRLGDGTLVLEHTCVACADSGDAE